MRFTVIMPCHNNSEHVETALKSIVEQTLPAHEIIVVDDDSADATVSIVEKTGYANQIIRVKYRNAAASRNAGIKKASGDHVAFLDADNVWVPDHLARAATLLRSEKDGLYISPPLRDVSCGIPTRGVIRPDFPLSADTTRLGKKDFVDWRLFYSWGFPTTGTVIRHDILERISGFDVNQINRHDFELVMRAICETTWCASPTSTWWSRPTRKGDISHDKARCAYFCYRAFKKNEHLFNSEAYSRLLTRAARHAIKLAFLEKNTYSLGRTFRLVKADLKAFSYIGSRVSQVRIR